ncbi:MAG: helicase [Actinomycetota bacterium]|nr:helicase [Actinomycetota bacterium]
MHAHRDAAVGADIELLRERAHLDAAYERVVAMRAAAEAMARTARRSESRNAQALFERDSAIAHAGRRLDSLDIAKDRLVVGRLDLDDGTSLCIGRLAVANEEGDPLVVDWRAPAAEAFYRALPHEPMGVVRRRHFRWRGGELVGLDDEVFDVDAAGTAGLGLVGEGALLAALDAPRTGRMADVVATIQAEQDVVIRRPRTGITVVQGAPGTGKTAVALHRAAYLLYGHRTSLTETVLFVGPSATFLRYVSDVVPSLGEDRVVLATPAELGPPAAVTRVDPPAAAAVKGDGRMVEVLARAVRHHQRAPRDGIELGAGRFRLRVDHDELAGIVATARQESDTHNSGRPLVELLVVGALGAAYHRALERDHRHGRIGSEGVEHAAPVLDVVDRRALAAAIDRMWPVLTPERLVRRLLRSPTRRERAGRNILTAGELDALGATDDDRGWSEADVALLDEAAVLLGPLPERAQPTRKRRPKLDHVAERVLEERVPDCPRCGRPMQYLPGEASGEDQFECRECKATYATTSLVGDPAANELHGIYEELAHQFEPEETTTVRPGDARYRHVVVDEAQDLSAMQWRAVARRCPSRSMTLAGDEAQAVRAGAAATWDRILDALDVGDAPVSRHELTVNYRTPAEVMELAARLLERFAPHLRPARSVRTTGTGPRRVHTGGRPLSAGDLTEAVDELDRAVGAGLIAVVAPEHHGLGPTDRAEQLTAVEAKGLEYDGVVVADPEAIVAESPGAAGMARLYVALTRATTALTVLAPTPPAAPLADALGPFDAHTG